MQKFRIDEMGRIHMEDEGAANSIPKDSDTVSEGLHSVSREKSSKASSIGSKISELMTSALANLLGLFALCMIVAIAIMISGAIGDWLAPGTAIRDIIIFVGFVLGVWLGSEAWDEITFWLD